MTPPLLAVEVAQALAARRPGRAALAAAALAAVAGAWWAFTRGYAFVPSADGFKFPHDHPAEYLWFVGAMLANLYGVVGNKAVEVTFGLAVAAALVAVTVAAGWRLVRRGVVNDRPAAALFTLAAFELIFCGFTAVGRVCLGWEAQALVSRYVTLMIPAGLVLLVAVGRLRSTRAATVAVVAYTAAVAIGSQWLPSFDRRRIFDFHDRRLAWKTFYLATGDPQDATRRSGFVPYPVPEAIVDRLQYLKANRLNLFAAGPGSAGRASTHPALTAAGPG